MADRDDDKQKASPVTVVAAAEPEPASGWQWLTDQSGWDAFSAQARAAGEMAIDTEFVRRRTYHAQLGLVQLAAAGQVWLLDPLTQDRRAELGGLLADPTLRKWIHAGGEDIEVLARWTGARPQQLLDTQIAAQLCGTGGQIGYQRLVAEQLSVTLSKGEQQSDWLRRPLTPQQCRYAADDVRYLLPLAQRLLEQVDQRQRREWLIEDCERQVERVLAPVPAWMHLSERNAGQYPPAVQHRMNQLLHWRQVEAERRDKPRSWILPNGSVVALAFAGTDDRAAVIRALQEAGRHDPQRDADRMLELLASFGPVPADFPLAGAPLEGAEKGQLTLLRKDLEALAQANDLAPEFIATRVTLEARVRTGQWPDSLGRWRLQLLEGIGERTP